MKKESAKEQKDSLKEFYAARESLKGERLELEQRLREIDAVLGENNRPPGRRNALSLKEAIVKVTSEQPLDRYQVLEAVQKLGYQFATDNPLNSIGVVLYGKSPKFKNANGKFSPA